MYRLDIRIRSDDTIRPNTNTLFGTEANIRYIPSHKQRNRPAPSASVRLTLFGVLKKATFWETRLSAK